jgi:hypothetical protein
LAHELPGYRNIAISFALLFIVLALTTIPVASAHEHRQVLIDDVNTEWTVGWFVEPAYVDQPNKVSLRVALSEGEHQEEHDEEMHEETANALLGLEKVLQVEVVTGGKAITLDLDPAWMDPGHYVAEIVPTVPGTYVFRFFGNVNGTQVDQSFDCSDGMFDCIQLLSDVQFPEQLQSSRDLQTGLKNIGEELIAIRSEISSVYLIGIAGIIAGVAGMALGVAAIIKRRKKP